MKQTMKDVWWDFALGGLFLWIAYDNLTSSHRHHWVNYTHDRWEFWMGVVIATAAMVNIIRGVVVWIKLRRQRANSPSAISK